MYLSALVLGAALLAVPAPRSAGGVAPTWRLVATVDLAGESGSAVSAREGVLAAMVEEGGLPVGRVYRTEDGGRTWAEERVEGGVPSSPLSLSADGEVLTSLEHTVVRLYRRDRAGSRESSGVR